MSKLLLISFGHGRHVGVGLGLLVQTTGSLCFLDGVGHLSKGDLSSFLVLLVFLVFLLRFIGGEIATARNAVVLAETGLIFVDWLVLEHLGVLGQHVL